MAASRTKGADVVELALAGDLEGARAALTARLEADAKDPAVFVDGWRVAVALESDDDAIAWVNDAFEQQVPLLEHLETRPLAQRRALLGSTSCRWAQLVEVTSPVARARLLLARIQVLVGDGRGDQARQELSAPDLRRDASDDEGLAIAALRGLVAVAWQDPVAAVAAAEGFAGAKSEAAAEARGRLAAVIAIAESWRALCEALEVPEDLRAFISHASMAERGERVSRAAAVIALLEEQPGEVLSLLARASREHPMVALYLAQLFGQLSGDGSPTLAELDKAEFDALGRTLVDLNDSLSAGLRWWQVLGVAVAARIGLDFAGAGIAADLLAWGGALTYFGRSVTRDKERYDEVIRPALIAHVAKTGTPAKCIVSWLANNGRMAPRVRNFDVAIEADDGLALLALLARAARVRAG